MPAPENGHEGTWARALLWLAVCSIIGCAHGDGLFGFPPAGNDPNPPTQPSSDAPVDEDTAAPTLIRARFRTSVALAEINRTACSLQASIAVDGHSKRIDLHIGGVTPCTAPTEGALRANVFVNADGNAHEVVLELVVPDGSSPNEVRDLKEGVRDVEHELARRIAFVERASIPRDASTIVRRDRRTKSAKLIRTSGILWAVTAGLAATGGLFIAGALAKSCCGGDFGWSVAGYSTLMGGAAPMFLAALVTSIAAAAYFASEDR
jgi:hypothetical protein